MNKVNLTTDGDNGVFMTLQGEGSLTGTNVVFCRFSGCNLRCAWNNLDGSQTLCDSPNSSFTPEINRRTVEEVVQQMNSYNRKYAVISGGEPFLQEDALIEMVYSLKNSGHHVTIETNGTVFFNTEADLISISPKLSTSSSHAKNGKAHDKKRINLKSLALLVMSKDCQLKFVVNTPEDIQEIRFLLDDILIAIGKEYERLNVINPPITWDVLNSKVWLMSQGIATNQFSDRLDFILDACGKYNWSFSDRLHVRLFGNVRGT